jgi:hypothetical protein
MTLSDFLAQVAFPSASPQDARVLSHFRRLLNSEHLLQQMLLKQHRRPSVVASAPLGFPKMLKLLWLKAPFARKPEQVHFLTIPLTKPWGG